MSSKKAISVIETKRGGNENFMFVSRKKTVWVVFREEHKICTTLYRENTIKYMLNYRHFYFIVAKFSAWVYGVFVSSIFYVNVLVPVYSSDTIWYHNYHHHSSYYGHRYLLSIDIFYLIHLIIIHTIIIFIIIIIIFILLRRLCQNKLTTAQLVIDNNRYISACYKQHTATFQRVINSPPLHSSLL